MGKIEIPDEYGYVLLSAVSTFLVAQYLGLRVSSFRKVAKIPYPYEYASYEQVQTASPSHSKVLLAFNAAQRAHQNFNEVYPSTLAALLITGLKYPVVTAGLGALWSVSRVLYAIGYTNTADTGGKGRYNGGLGLIVQYALPLVSGWVAWTLAMK